MANITSGCTVIATETFGKGKIVIFSTAASADDQDYIVMDNATLSNTLTGEKLVCKAGFQTMGYANVFSGLTTDATIDPIAFDTTVIVLKGAEDNRARTVFAYCESVTSTGG